MGGLRLNNGLESQDASAAELAQACERVFEAVDSPKGVEFVDDEPEFLISIVLSLGLALGFEDGETHPGADEAAERGDLLGSVGLSLIFVPRVPVEIVRSEEHTSELQS